MPDSSKPGAQFRVQEKPILRPGIQTLDLPLAQAPKGLMTHIQRICFAMEASGFRKGKWDNAFRVHNVSFR
jgi:hypothetical protein